MGIVPAATSPTEFREIRRNLTAANDAKVRRVVAMVDAIANRGAADALIAPLRDRLAHLRPTRKLRLERLLFLPLDPLIVAPQDWRANMPTIPRNAIAPITGTVRITLGRDLQPILAAMAGKTTQDTDAVAEAGAMLWPFAASMLAIAPLPSGWVEAGLKPAAYKPLVSAIAAVLDRLPTLQPLFQDASNGMLALREEVIEGIVAELAGEAPEVQGMVVALLLARLPQAGSLLQRIESMARSKADRVALRLASDQAADALLNRLEAHDGTEAPIIGVSLAEAGAEIRRLGALLQELESRTGTPERRARLKAIRSRLDASCRTRFAAGLTDGLLIPSQTAPVAIDRAAQQELEAAARQLRSMELTARKIGSAGVYDDLLLQATTVVKSINAGVLSLSRAARLVEILAGADAAMALLEARQ
jgi:hypothetical protein